MTGSGAPAGRAARPRVRSPVPPARPAVRLVRAMLPGRVDAITGNFVPDFEHEYVGLIVFYDAEGKPSHRCSGSLLTDQVFLTAGHCVTLDDEGTLATSARVYFEQDVDAVEGYPTSGGIAATELHSYGYEGLRNLPQSRDLGVVILSEPVTNVYDITEYASLAAAGTLDTYGTGIDATVELSGYGVQNANKHHVVAARERLRAETFIIGGRNPLFKSAFDVQLASNPGGGRGGTCFGDSGGPVLLGDTDVVVAVNSFVLNGNCAGQGFGYRTDQQAVIDFILDVAGDEADEIVIVRSEPQHRPAPVGTGGHRWAPSILTVPTVVLCAGRAQPTTM